MGWSLADCEFVRIGMVGLLFLWDEITLLLLWDERESGVMNKDSQQSRLHTTWVILDLANSAKL